MESAFREQREFIAADKDFGELAFRSRLPATCGVVLFRVTPDPAVVAAIAIRAFAGAPDFRGKFVVVEANRIRERQLPPE